MLLLGLDTCPHAAEPLERKLILVNNLLYHEFISNLNHWETQK